MRSRGGAFLVVLALGCGKTVALGHGTPGRSGQAGNASAGDAATGGSGGSNGSSGSSAGAGGPPDAQGEAGAAGTPEAGPLVISGKVVTDGDYPVAGFTLEVQEQAVTSAADGSFQALVTLPYDIVVRDQTAHVEVVYLGVTRQDPKLDVSTTPDRSVALKGKVTGGAASLPLTSFSRVVVGSRYFLQTAFEVDADGIYDSARTWALGWYGPTSVSATLLALQGDLYGVTPAERISAIGTKQITLTSSAPVELPDDVVLGPPSFHDLELNLQLPDGPPDFCVCQLLLPGIVLAEVGCAEPQLQLQAPDIGDLAFQLYCSGHFDERAFQLGQEVRGDAVSATVIIPRRSPVVQQPGASASGKASSIAFQVTPARAAMTRLMYSSRSDVDAFYTVAVYTNDERVELTRLLKLGLSLPAGQPIHWHVTGMSQVETVDDYLAPAYDPRALSVTVEESPVDAEGRTFRYELD